jgi:hypothetical protein
MSDWTCQYCNKEFRYPSILKRHLRIKNKCTKQTSLTIDPVSPTTEQTSLTIDPVSSTTEQTSLTTDPISLLAAEHDE